MKLYIHMLQNDKGQWYKKDSLNGCWVDDPQEASVWTTPRGPSGVKGRWKKNRNIMKMWCRKYDKFEVFARIFEVEL